MTIGWQQGGRNVPDLLQGMAKLFQIGLDHECILDSIIAWEGVASVTYNL